MNLSFFFNFVVNCTVSTCSFAEFTSTTALSGMLRKSACRESETADTVSVRGFFLGTRISGSSRSDSELEYSSLAISVICNMNHKAVKSAWKFESN